MSQNLKILLLIFAILFIFLIIRILRSGKIPVKYSLVWLAALLVILLVALFPNFVTKITHLLGFQTISNMIIGIFLTLLLIITLVLTTIVSRQKQQITSLIQEVSLLKESINVKKSK